MKIALKSGAKQLLPIPQLLSDYYKRKQKLPNPDDPTDFEDIFLGRRGDPPQTHILGRLGIIGPKRDYLVRLVCRFIEKGGDLNANDLTDLINEKENFKTVRSAGLLQEEWLNYQVLHQRDQLI